MTRTHLVHTIIASSALIVLGLAVEAMGMQTEGRIMQVIGFAMFATGIFTVEPNPNSELAE